MVRLDSPRVTVAAAAALAVLLVVLATLQYRWLDQVSAAERDRAKASVAAAAYGFAADFDREIGRVITCFEPWPDSRQPASDWFADSWQRCGKSDLQSLVAAAYLAEKSDGDLTLSRLDPATGRLAASPWPAELADVRARLVTRTQETPAAPSRFSPIDPDLPAVVLSERRALRNPPGTAPKRFVILRLDSTELTRDLFPELTRRYFGSGHLQDYDLAVFRRGDPSRPVYASDPANAVSPVGGDATADLLTHRVFAERRRADANRRAAPPAGLPGPVRRAGIHDDPGAAGAWRLIVAHRGGSLEAAVARVRRRNLGLGLGILGILAGAVAMTVLSARRAQRLARQQIDFVASVSHELHTPLAAIRSAGQNLADGVVTESEQVRRYGSLIENEGRRLSEMVAHVLDFAGIRSGRRNYRMRPVAVNAIVDGALSQCRWSADQKGIRIETRVAPDLPPVLADAEALGRALRNLMENAIKYGGGERWMGVRAELVVNGDPPQVAISVEDRGPGVRETDRQRIFEPFYRGEESASTGVSGSGLGLALVRPIVEAHGGTVTVESNGGGAGARFVVRLPAAPAGLPEEGLPS
ncbi:MAG TPA: HAMP domain-containing sensor histidine kinase [Thermoanaerobaculia bacterium]